MKKRIGMWLFVLMILISNITGAQKCSAMELISLDAATVENVSLSGSVSGKNLLCSLNAVGQKSAKSITGTLSVKDNASGKVIATWKVSQQGKRLCASKKTTIKKKNSYTVSFNGTIHYASKSTSVKKEIIIYS